MVDRRQFLTASATIATSSLAGCIDTGFSSTETFDDSKPDYDVSAECPNNCEFTVTLLNLGYADYLLVEAPGTEDTRLTKSKTKVTVETVEEYVNVYAVRDGDRTLLKRHEYQPSETSTESSRNPQAGVRFDQTDTSPPTSVEVMLISMANADFVRVKTSSQDDQTYKLDTIGESVTVEGLESGDKVIVVGVLDGSTSVLHTYTVD